MHKLTKNVCSVGAGLKKKKKCSQACSSVKLYVFNLKKNFDVKISPSIE